MAGGPLRLLGLAALVGTTAALVHRSRGGTENREAPASCDVRAPPVDLAAREGEFGTALCDDLIPHYDMAQWLEEHGQVTPDHPAVFTNTGTHESEVFPDSESFLQQHGEEWVVALPEYAQSGGTFKNPFAQGKVNATFRTLPSIWNHTKLYFSDFKCVDGSLCDQVSHRFGQPALFRSHEFRSKNFLVGGPDSGLPFHKHGMTWQGLCMGRKAWYILPPGSMSEYIHDVTGPYIFPVRAYHHILREKPVGQRPLYCVQHPGEVVFVPDSWWHATMNLDGYEVAYGEKPMLRQLASPSDALTRILSVFPSQSWDSAGFTAAMGGPLPMPYAVVPRQTALQTTCGDSLDGGSFSLEEPLRRMRLLQNSREFVCGVADVAAWAHCLLAGELRRLVNNHGCLFSQAKRQELLDYGERWRSEASQLSPELVQTEAKICAVRR